MIKRSILPLFEKDRNGEGSPIEHVSAGDNSACEIQYFYKSLSAFISEKNVTQVDVCVCVCVK